MRYRNFFLTLALLAVLPIAGKVKVKTVCPQTEYAATRLQDIGEKYTITIEIRSEGRQKALPLAVKGRKSVLSAMTAVVLSMEQTSYRNCCEKIRH
jgi:hypothetical protein